MSRARPMESRLGKRCPQGADYPVPSEVEERFFFPRRFDVTKDRRLTVTRKDAPSRVRYWSVKDSPGSSTTALTAVSLYTRSAQACTSCAMRGQVLAWTGTTIFG